MTTNIIKLKFVHSGVPKGREYAYFSNTEVEVGEIVNIDGKKLGIVTEINVSEEEIAPFKDRAKTIVGKIEETESEVSEKQEAKRNDN